MKLICIDDVTDSLNFGDGVKELTFGKEYEIKSFYEKKPDGRQYISLINDKGISNDYLISRFTTLKQFRELQLKKLGIS
jgi:hypothetical protein